MHKYDIGGIWSEILGLFYTEEHSSEKLASLRLDLGLKGLCKAYLFLDVLGHWGVPLNLARLI